MFTSRLRLPWFVASAAALFVFAACGDDGPTTPSTGSVEVTAATTGEDIDSDGYTVTVNGGSGQSLAVNGSATVPNVTTGEATVELSGVADNCTVSGDNPRTVQVTGGQTASTTFEISCVAQTGEVEVTTATTGDDLDSDGYTVQVDGSDVGAIGINETMTFSGIDAGDHTVSLTGVAANCTVQNNDQTATVPAGGSVAVSFDVACSAQAGSVEVTTSTTGDEQDADGYTVEVDGSSVGTIGINETKSFSGIADGDHTVSLSGVAANCAVQNNDQTVTVPADGSVAVSFDVSCSTTSGAVDVTTSTTGDDLDSDGYTVQVDGSGVGSIGVNDANTFTGIPEGTRTVSLTDVAANCTVQSNDQSVTVPAGGSVSVTFDVDCVTTTGSADVTTATTGQNLDPDGYTITVDPGTVDQDSQPIGTDATVNFTGLTTDDHVFELTNVADNCSVSGDNPRTITVTEAGVSTTFDVNCWAPLDNKIVFDSDRDDPGGNASIYVMNPDGSGLQRLTDPAFNDANPHVSPDGNKILFASNRGGAGPDIYMMNPDGSGVTNMTGGFGGYNPQWSPLGDKFVWTRPLSGNAELWVKDNLNQPDDRRQLTDSPGFDDLGTWSPDGSTIAFTSVRCTDMCVEPDSLDVWVVPASADPINDASAPAPTRVTTTPGLDGNPSWVEQGDGTNLIAFTSRRDGDEEIYVVEVNADGTNPVNETNLTLTPGFDDGFPTWKPDGTMIAFFSNRDGNSEIYTMNADGSGQTPITSDPAEDLGPAWSADLP